MASKQAFKEGSYYGKQTEIKSETSDMVRFSVTDDSGDSDVLTCRRDIIMRYPNTYLAELVLTSDNEIVTVKCNIDLFEWILNIYLGFPKKITLDTAGFNLLMQKCKEFKIDVGVIIDCIVNTLTQITEKNEANTEKLKIILHNVQMIQKYHAEKMSSLDEVKKNADLVSHALISRKQTELNQMTDETPASDPDMTKLTLDKAVIDVKILLKQQNYSQLQQVNQALVKIVAGIENNLR